ncbi:MAG: hypothetical protein ABII01_03825 [Candidatus Woesearchaeota archaeon]
MTTQEICVNGLEDMKKITITLADVEGLEAHKKAAELRKIS